MTLTIFACPKPFVDPHIATIQRNAILSWTKLAPAPEVILCGDELGTAEMCREIGAKHVGSLKRNAFGTPMLDDIFRQAAAAASGDIHCYVNSDIILLGEFTAALAVVERRWRRRFLMVGERADLALDQLWDFERPDWSERLRQYAEGKLTFPGPLAVDYFCFRRGQYDGVVPSFALGRAHWAGWLVYQARASGVPVVDATRIVPALHQNHDYSHLSYATSESGVPPRVFWKRVAGKLEEFKANSVLLGRAEGRYFGLADATHILTPRGLKRALTRDHLLRKIQVLPTFHSAFSPVATLAALMFRVAPVRRFVSNMLEFSIWRGSRS